jgi:hypothetical protein
MKDYKNSNRVLERVVICKFIAQPVDNTDFIDFLAIDDYTGRNQLPCDPLKNGADPVRQRLSAAAARMALRWRALPPRGHSSAAREKACPERVVTLLSIAGAGDEPTSGQDRSTHTLFTIDSGF